MTAIGRLYHSVASYYVTDPCTNRALDGVCRGHSQHSTTVYALDPLTGTYRPVTLAESQEPVTDRPGADAGHT